MELSEMQDFRGWMGFGETIDRGNKSGDSCKAFKVGRVKHSRLGGVQQRARSLNEEQSEVNYT